MGTPDFSVPALEAIAAGHEVVAVYTQPARAAGRGQKPRPSPVAVMAERLGLEVRTPEHLRDDSALEALTALQADVAVVVAYGLILPQAVLDAPRLGCLNIHASILPRWRGAAPIQRAIMAGDPETGVAIMQMEAGLDTGPVLAEARTIIGPEDTAADLHDRLSRMGAELIIDVLDQLPLPARPQAETGAIHAEKISKSEAKIDWTEPAAMVDRHIRGLSPFPGAWCLAGGERLKITRSRLASSGEGTPGTVLDGLCIACGDGAIEVLEAQREGRRPMPADELLKGWTPPERLE